MQQSRGNALIFKGLCEIKERFIQMLSIKFIVGFGLLGVMGLPAIAEDTVKAMPSQIVVTGERCPKEICVFGGGRKEDRRLVLMLPKADGVEAKGAEVPEKKVEAKSVRIVSLDLDRKDSQAVFSAQKIKVDQTGELKLSPGQALLVPLSFQLGDAAASGEYAGNLLIQHEKGELLVPVTVKLRDPWWVALGVLGLGVGLASVLSFYQAEGFDRDEVRSAMAKLRKRMKTEGLTGEDAAVERLFKDWVEVCLEEVEVHLDEKRWEDGRKGLKEGQRVWGQWQENQKLWVEWWKYGMALKGRIGKNGDQIPEHSSYAKRVGLMLDGVVQKIASYETIEKFSQELEPIDKSIKWYFTADALLRRIEDLCLNINDNQLKEKGATMRQRLEALSPTDESAHQAWFDAGEALETDMRSKVPTAMGRGDGGKAIDPLMALQVPTGKASEVSPEDDGGAGGRLWRDELVKRLVFWGLMCGLGFSQVYGGNLTFGANPGADYYGLFAWGFGAEATRDSLAKVLQRKSKAGEGK